MAPDVFMTVAFVLYAVFTAAGTGLLIARSEWGTVVDQAAETRLNGNPSTARPAAQGVPVVSGRHRRAPRG